MKKWEYRVRKNDTIEQMNSYGKEGWELIAVVGAIGFYKRELE